MPRESDLGFRADTAAGWAAAEVGGVATSAGENVWIDNDLVKCDGVTKVADLPRAGTGTYARLSSLAPLSRVVVLGDSTDYGSDNYANSAGTARGRSWPMFAELASNGAFHYVWNAAVTGNTTGQYLARFDAEVAPLAPTAVVFGSITNDIGGSVPLATTQANIATLVAKCRTIGALPILRTTTPLTGGGGPQQVRAYNTWLKAWAIQRGLFVIDAYAATVDPATGSYLTAMDSGDHIHPSEAGYKAIGDRAVTDLARLLGPVAVPRLLDAGDTSNVLQVIGADPLFLTGTIGANKDPGNGWSVVNPTSCASATLDATDTTINGKWYRMNFSGSASAVTLYHPSPGVSVTAGRVYAFTGLCDINLSVAGSGGVHIQLGNTGTCYAVYAAGTTRHKGRFWTKFTAAGTGVNTQVVVPAGSTGSVSVAELAVFDLTALGIADLV